MEVHQIGMPAYNKGEWDELKSLMPDMYETYEEWWDASEKGFQHLKARGSNVVRVPVSASDIREYMEKNPGKEFGEVRTGVLNDLQHKAFREGRSL